MKTIHSLARLGISISVLAWLTAVFGGESPQIAWMAGGHPYGAAAVRFTSDGQRLISGGAGLKVWDFAAQRLERTLCQPRIGDDGFALSSDDRWVVSVPWHPNRGLVIRDVRDGAERARFPFEEPATPVLSLSFSPDNAWVLGSSADGRLIRWHVPTRTALAPLSITDLRPNSPSGLWATLVSSNEFIGTDFTGLFRARFAPPELLWDQPVPTHSLPAFAPASGRFAVSLEDRLALIDGSSGQVIWETEPMLEPPLLLAFSGDGQRIVGTHKGADLQVWRALDGALELKLPGVDEVVTEVAVSPDGRTVAAGHNRGIALWDLEAHHGPEELTRMPSIIYSLGVSTNGLVAAGTGMGQVTVFDLGTGRLVATWRPTTGRRAVAMAPSGEWLVTDGTNMTLSVYRLPAGEFEQAVPLPGTNPDQLALSADGRRLAVLPLEGGPVIVRTADWTVERTIDIRPAPSWRGAHLSADGEWLAGVDGNGMVKVWRMADGGLVGSMPGYGAETGPVEFDDPAPLLWVLGRHGGVLRWDPVTGEIETRPTLDVTDIICAAWLPDRSAVLLSLQDQGLELWRLDTSARVKRYDTEVGRVCYAMAISPDERALLLGRYDATLVAAALPFFLDLARGDSGQIVIHARGPTTRVHWETNAGTGSWSPLEPGDAQPLIVPTSALRSEWFRAVIGP